MCANDAKIRLLVGTMAGTASAGYPARSMPLLLTLPPSAGPAASPDGEPSRKMAPGDENTRVDASATGGNASGRGATAGVGADVAGPTEASDSSAAVLEMALSVVSPASPLFEEAAAQVLLHVALQPVQVHAVPSVVHTVLQNVLRGVQLLEEAQLNVFEPGSSGTRYVALHSTPPPPNLQLAPRRSFASLM